VRCTDAADLRRLLRGQAEDYTLPSAPRDASAAPVGALEHDRAREIRLD
jgi:hypothetical protein